MSPKDASLPLMITDKSLVTGASVAMYLHNYKEGVKFIVHSSECFKKRRIFVKTNQVQKSPKMINKYFVALFMILSAICFISAATKDYSHLIFPKPDQKICLVRAIENGDKNILAGKIIETTDPVHEMIMKDLNLPFHQSLIKLNQCSRNLSGNSEGPNVLFISADEGGFSRTGLELMDSSGRRTAFPALNYVDLVLDVERVEQGDLDIFSHELGHVMMNNIMSGFMQNAPKRMTSKQHVSMGVTDYYTAFFEGWAIHFECSANDIEKYKRNFDDRYRYNRILSALWHSTIDRELRITGVKQNRFIHQKLMPQVLPEKNMTVEEMILWEHTSPVFDVARLRNGQQMMSSEGMLASLFYQINSNKALQAHYRDDEFYRAFLIQPLPKGISPEEIFSPYENVVLKNFYVWHLLKKNPSFDEKPVFTEFVRVWCESFPEDKKELLEIFINLTSGMTVTPELGEVYENTAHAGAVGNYFSFMEMMKKYREIIKSVFPKVAENLDLLDANVGPELWIENKKFQIRRSLWVADIKTNLNVNINTASVYDLASFPGMAMERVAEVIKKRQESGYFRSLAEARKAGWDPEERIQ